MAFEDGFVIKSENKSGEHCTQTHDSFTCKIAAGLGCDDDREGWHTYNQHWEEEQQHCGEGDTSVWQDPIKKILNIYNLYDCYNDTRNGIQIMTTKGSKTCNGS